MASEIYGYPTSDVSTPEQACNFIYDFSYSNGVSGLGDLYPYGEYLVEVVGGSGGASNCVVNNTNPNSITTGTCTTGASSTGSTNNPDTNAPQGSLTVVNDGWPKPSWQTGVSGIPNDGVRDIPDVSFFASAGFLSSSAYLVCVSQDSNGYGGSTPCSYSSSQEPFAQEVGGTSVATPAMAGVMALINQKAGAAQGSPNSELYALAQKQPYSSCSAENATISDGCYFNDIVKETNAQPCDYIDGTPNCVATQSTLGSADEIGILPGYNAGMGYDEATGLGSLNVANVVNGWTATVGTGTATVTIAPATATPDINDWLMVAVSVSAAGGPMPTGQVTLVATTGGGPPLVTLTGTLTGSGTYTFNIPNNTLIMGADLLTVTYGGDSTYASASNSATINVSDAAQTTPTVSLTPGTQTVNSEGAFTETVTVGGTQGAATGYVELTSGGYSSGWQPFSGGSYQFTIGSAGTQSPLATGTDTLTVNYSGGTVYSAGSATAQVTVTASTFKLSAGTASPSSVTPGGSATITVTAAPTAGYTGTVTLSCAQTSTTATNSDGTTCAGSGNSQINLATCGSNCSLTFTIGTYAPVAALARPRLPGNKQWLGAGSGAVLALLVFFGIPARRRSWRNMLAVLFAFAAIGVMASCGGGSKTVTTGGGGNTDPGTTAGTYTYTVTATANPSVTPTVSTTFQVTVN